MNKKQENLTGFLLLLIALCLKTLLILDHPLGYDELSAVFRANVSTWKEHIETGVLPDGHPAGLQTWLWLWLKIIGDSAFALKFQAVMASILASYLLWKTLSKMYGAAAGLTGLVFFLFSPLAFHWSMQFRPYAFGMLFISLQWWLYTHSENFKRKSAVLIIIGAFLLSICGYIHYFAGLSAFLILLYFRLVSVINTPTSIYTLFLAAVLYLPGLEIFLSQLQNGGLEWLGKPDPSFFFTHITLITTGNKFLTAASILLLLWKSGNQNAKTTAKKPTLLLVSFWLLPILLGYAWSYFQKPVLQNSVLLFSSPFLLVAIGSRLSAMKLKTNAILTIVFATFFACNVNLWQRKLFGEANKDALYNVSMQLKNLKINNPEAGLWYDGPRDILQYHWNQRPPTGNLPGSLFGSEKTTLHLRALIDTLKKMKTAGIGINSGTYAGLIPVIEDNTRMRIERTRYPFGEFLLLNHSSEQSTNMPEYTVYNPQTDKVFTLKELNAGKNDVIVVRMKINDTANLKLVSSISHNNVQSDWRESPAEDWAKAGFGYAYHFIKMADIPGIKPKSEIKIWVANDQGPVTGRPLEIRISEGNPMMYGTLND